MTPEVQAKELYNKFWLIEDENGHLVISRFCAKKCALITVEEIILELDKGSENYSIYLDYWNEVKIEIEKL